MTRELATVDCKVNTSACRLCGGTGRDPYTHRSVCRKCNGRKVTMSRVALDSQVAWNRYKAELAKRDFLTHEDLVAAVEFIGTLRACKALVTYMDELS